MNERRKLPEPRLIKCFASQMYLLVVWHIGRTPASPYTLDIRQIDGNHIGNVLLAKEDLENLVKLSEETP